jgi:Family of unknown function (DUF5706)
MPRWGFKRRNLGTNGESAGLSPVETAWRIHAALLDWTGKVDNKAAFVLGLESAVLASFVTIGNVRHHLLRGPIQLQQILLLTGFVHLVSAMVLAIAVVAPRMSHRSSARDWAEDVVYFGHLRLWNPVALCEELATADMLPILSRNLAAMSRILWRKHLLVRVSLLMALLGACLVIAASIIQ